MALSKKFKILLSLVIIAVVIFGAYLYKLHALAVEANDIFAIRCRTVNPPLINYKISFLNLADAINSPGKYSSDEVRSFYDGYVSGMKNYVKEENKWLAIQNKLIKRWDFQLIEPWYTKKAEDLQWKMYEAYRDDAQYILDLGEKKPVPKDFPNLNVRDTRDKVSQEYFDFYTKAIAIKDWKKFFGRVSLPKVCTEKNLTIPNTEGSIDWEGKSATPSSDFVPIDPYNVI